MKIVIRTEEKKTRVFQFPTGILLNRFSIRYSLKKQGMKLTNRQATRFLKELRAYRREHRDLVWFEIRDKKNRHVQITL